MTDDRHPGGGDATPRCGDKEPLVGALNPPDGDWGPPGGEWDPLGGNLVFLFSPPRSGSTMLQLMIESHSLVHGLPEPFVMVALKHSGFFDAPIQAKYDVLNATLAMREFIRRLPGGEEDYIEACRAYTNKLYSSALSLSPGCRYFIEKTPPNILEWEFITRVYPRAKYVMLTRHPLGVLHSMAQTSFKNDYQLVREGNPVIIEYIPAVASFIRDATVDSVQVCYEDIVGDPETHARRVLDFLGLEFETACVEYGQKKHVKGALGDPIAAHQLSRPVTSSAYKWAKVLADDGVKLEIAREIIDRIDPADLETYGNPVGTLFDPVMEHSGGSGEALQRTGRRFNAYRLKRQVFFFLRWCTRPAFMRTLLERVRYYCDVLLTR